MDRQRRPDQQRPEGTILPGASATRRHGHGPDSGICPQGPSRGRTALHMQHSPLPPPHPTISASSPPSRCPIGLRLAWLRLARAWNAKVRITRRVKR